MSSIYKAAYIEWVDSAGMSGWKTKESGKSLQPMLISSVGFVINRTRKFVTLALSIGDDDFDGLISIPKVAITKFEYINGYTKHE